MITTLPGAFPTTPSPPRPPPRRTDSLSSSIAKPKPTSPLVQAREDAKFARVVLNTPASDLYDEGLSEDERDQRREQRERELVEMLARMTGWVEELGTLLQQAYKNQTDLETALTLTRSNLQLALANNEMLEDALKRTGGNGKDVGWRRWSEQEDMRRTNSLKDYSSRSQSISEASSRSPTPSPITPPQPQTQQQQQTSATSRFFNFGSLTRISSSPSPSPSNTSPTATGDSPTTSAGTGTSFLPVITTTSLDSSRSPSPAPPTPIGPTQREKELAWQLEKAQVKLKELSDSKAQLESELESLSQALFEEANKMVAQANRKLAETEEELRITTDQRDALKGALRIVEGENGALRSRTPQASPQAPSPAEVDDHEHGQFISIPPRMQSMAGPLSMMSDYSQDSQATPRADDFPSPPSSTKTSSSFASSSTGLTPPSAPTLRIPTVTITPSNPEGSFWSPVTPDSVGSASPATPLRRYRSSGNSPLSPVPESPNSIPETPISYLGGSDTGESSRSRTPSPPPPGSQSSSSPELDPHIPLPKVSDSPASSLPVPPPVPGDDDETSSRVAPKKGGVRWSVIPKTPRSRDAVRSEFEEAMKRMEQMVVEEGVPVTPRPGQVEDLESSPTLKFAKIVQDEGEEDENPYDGIGDGRTGSADEVERLVGGVNGGNENPWRT